MASIGQIGRGLRTIILAPFRQRVRIGDAYVPKELPKRTTLHPTEQPDLFRRSFNILSGSNRRIVTARNIHDATRRYCSKYGLTLPEILEVTEDSWILYWGEYQKEIYVKEYHTL